MTDWEFRLWSIVTWLKHVAGVHTLVPVEHWEWDDSGSAIISIGGWTCWRCDYRRP